MPKFLLALLFGIFMLPNELYAQDSIENAMMSMQEIITEIASGLEDGTDMDELADLLNNLTENPIHINTATDEDLEKLFWLSEFQILNIKAYIKTYGAIASVYEIVNIQGFSEKDAKLLSPFLLFDIPGKELSVSPELLLRNSHHRLLLRSQRVLETQKGFSAEETPNGSGYFKGGPTSAYVRYSGQFNKKASAGFTAKNDAGEEFFKGSNKQGFDFYSFYMQLNRLRFIKTFVLGDYRVYFGQGLAVWSGLSFGKSPIVLSSMQRGQGITRYQSSDENNFFRGAAITCDLKPIEISLWASSHRIDANITGKDSLSGDITEVSSLQTSGLHTVSSEIADEDAIRSNVLGCNISLIKPNLRAGITAICYTYSSALNADLTPYNRYYFRGNSNYNLSWNFRYRKGNVIFFGEEAVSQSGGIAMLNGVQTYVDSRLSFIVLSRYYQRNYQSMYGKAFGENAGNSNEAGLFAGMECKPMKYITFSGYMDVFRFPWLTYGADMPSYGRDFLVQINYDPNNMLQMYLQYRNKSKNNNYSQDGDAKSIIARTIQERIRYSLTYHVMDNVTFQSRLELSRFKNELIRASRGFYLGQDVELSIPKKPVRFYLRYALFETDDYNSRIYVYENDLLYTFNIPAFSDKGSRTYIMVKYFPYRCLDVWLKYGITQYADKETVGTGLYEIQGNRKSELKVQLLLKL